MTDSSTEAPAFDPFTFPSDLIAAQRAAAEARADLHSFQGTLPWSREPHDGWDAPEETGGMSGYRSSRPPSPGWSQEQKDEYDRLWELCRSTSLAVYAHKHWTACGVRAVEARQALKRLPKAQPVVTTEIPEQAHQDVRLGRAAG